MFYNSTDNSRKGHAYCCPRRYCALDLACLARPLPQCPMINPDACYQKKFFLAYNRDICYNVRTVYTTRCIALSSLAWQRKGTVAVCV